MIRELERFVIAACVVVLAACGGSVNKDEDGDEDTDTEAPDITVDLAPDAEPEVEPDAEVDIDEDAPTPCETHSECLTTQYCGPCTRTACPCDLVGCDPYCIDNPCHDFTPVTCSDDMPTCPIYEVLTIFENCYECVNLDTCRSWSDPGCLEDRHCYPSYYCDPCAHGSCPDCDDCVQDCSAHGCPTEEEPAGWCTDPRPGDCGEGNVAVLSSGCWVCISMETCEEV